MPQLSKSRGVLPNAQHIEETTALGGKLGKGTGGQEVAHPRDEGGNGGFTTSTSCPQVALTPKDILRPPPHPSSPPLRAETLCPHHLRGKGWNSRTFCFPEKPQVKFQGQKLALGLGKRTLPSGVNGGGGWSAESPCRDLSGRIWVSLPHNPG